MLALEKPLTPVVKNADPDLCEILEQAELIYDENIRAVVAARGEGVPGSGPGPLGNGGPSG